MKPLILVLTFVLMTVGCISGSAQPGGEVYQVQTYEDRAISISYPELSDTNDCRLTRVLNPA